MSSNLITIQKGAEMAKIFKKGCTEILLPIYKDSGVLPTCETFDRSGFDTLLANPDCVGIRIYSGMDEDLNVRFIVVGVDANDRDIYISDPTEPLDLFVIEKGTRCPFVCPPASDLNS